MNSDFKSGIKEALKKFDATDDASGLKALMNSSKEDESLRKTFIRMLSAHSSPSGLSLFIKDMSPSKTEVESALFVSVSCGRKRNTEMLLDAGASPSCETMLDGKLSTPLSVSISEGHHRIFDMLLERGATVRDGGLAPVKEAIRGKKSRNAKMVFDKVIELLKKEGGVSSKESESLVIFAVRSGKTECLEKMAEIGMRLPKGFPILADGSGKVDAAFFSGFRNTCLSGNIRRLKALSSCGMDLLHSSLETILQVSSAGPDALDELLSIIDVPSTRLELEKMKISRRNIPNSGAIIGILESRQLACKAMSTKGSVSVGKRKSV